jgi:membrane associated rhomboid family serine protease
MRGAPNPVGIYDRDYYREEQRPGTSLPLPRSVVGWIIAVNVVVWLADFFVSESYGRPGTLGLWMAVHVDTIKHPWMWWQFLTAGFAHAPFFNHILFNMLGLFFLGREVEDVYGHKEFLRLYLAMIVAGFVIWNLLNLGSPVNTCALGASGAITGVVMLFALNFPRRMLLLFFVLPVPAWVVGVLLVATNVFGLTGADQQRDVAYSVHLVGAAFAFLYYQQQWNFSRLSFGRLKWPQFGGKPRLRVHQPEDEPEPDLNAEVDRILEKISRQGEASLTAKERKTLETASREYQKRGRRD